jgi:hypothetical protein
MPLGKVKSFCFCDQCQDTEENLCHMHTLIKTGHTLIDLESLCEFMNLMQATTVSLFDSDGVG